MSFVGNIQPLSSPAYQFHTMAGSCLRIKAAQVIIELEYATRALGDDYISTACYYGTSAGLAKFVGNFWVLEAGYATTAATGSGGG